MSHFDVFNGDADGICALQQLRLAMPMESALVTGVKRDIELLRRVAAQAGDTVTVLDVSLERNRQPLLALLERGVGVAYFDHHFAGIPLAHPGLDVHIDLSPTVCTSLIVNRHLQSQHRLWAVVGAFGDNLKAAAQALAPELAPQQIAQLHDLGEAMNYNAYGDTEVDLLLPPAELYASLRPYSDPFAFLAHSPYPQRLIQGRMADIARAKAIAAAYVLPAGSIYLLPDAAWARRVHGSFANERAQNDPRHAHAVLSPCAHGSYVVSVRAPLERPTGADGLCRQFPGGGGRAAAAGIDHLPHARLTELLDAFTQAFSA